MITIQKMVARAVDYAGLFPPANLSMQDTVHNFSRYRSCEASSMLGRLIVPTARLAEFQNAIDLKRLVADEKGVIDAPWTLSCIVPADPKTGFADFATAIDQIRDFNLLNQKGKMPAVVNSIELKINQASDIATLAGMISPGIDVYFEIDCQKDPSSEIATLSQIRDKAIDKPKESSPSSMSCRSNLFAKIRTGSTIAEQIPGSESVARFVALCARDSVPFKATAGLHHPLRNEYRLTYEPDSKCGVMHGFVNMFVATLAAFEYKLDEAAIVEILQEQDPNAFQFDDESIRWKQIILRADRIEKLRNHSIQSFGSCSFEEPSGELSSLYCSELFACGEM